MSGTSLRAIFATPERSSQNMFAKKDVVEYLDPIALPNGFSCPIEAMRL